MSQFGKEMASSQYIFFDTYSSQEDISDKS